MMRLLLAIGLSVMVSASAFAAEDSNVLVLEIAGEANGRVEIELLVDLAPNHVERIKTLTRSGEYDDVAFHRVIEGFMAQTGDVTHGKISGENLRYAGTGGSTLPNLAAEFSPIPFERGTVGMARSQDPNSANSQFFIMFEPAPHLNGSYTVFGRVISGQDVIDSIKRGAPGSGTVSEPDHISRAWIKSEGSE